MLDFFFLFFCGRKSCNLFTDECLAIRMFSEKGEHLLTYDEIKNNILIYTHCEQSESFRQSPFDRSFSYKQSLTLSRGSAQYGLRVTDGRHSLPCKLRRIPFRSKSAPRARRSSTTASYPCACHLLMARPIVEFCNIHNCGYTVAAAATASITANCTLTTAGEGGREGATMLLRIHCG